MIFLLAACMGHEPGSARPPEDTGTPVDDSAVPTPDSEDSTVDDSNDTTESTPPDSEPCDTAVFFRDADGDGHGTRDDTITGCEPPDGYVADDVGDCDDLHSAAWVGATEDPISGVDDDCSGKAASTSLEDLSLWQVHGTDTEWLGTSLTARGDYDGDGFADLAIGGQIATLGHEQRGAFTLLFAGPIDRAAKDLDASSASARLYGATDDDTSTVCAGGDLDGDGFEDLVVGAMATGTAAGATYVVPGPIDGDIDLLDGYPAVTDTTWGEAFGGCATPGDIDGDGFADLVVSAPWRPSDGVDWTGSVFVFHGPVEATSPDDADAVMHGASQSECIGCNLTVLGDVDGDGVLDLGVANLGYWSVTGDPATVYVVTESWTGVASPKDVGVPVVWDLNTSRYQMESNRIGDVDGDGYDEIAVSEQNETNSSPIEIVLGPFGGKPLAVSIDADIELEQGAGGGLISATALTNWNRTGENGIAVGQVVHSSAKGGRPNYSGAVYLLAAPIEPGTHLLGDEADQIDDAPDWAFMGDVLEGARDLDGDGSSDLAVGVDLWSTADTRGTAFVLFGE